MIFFVYFLYSFIFCVQNHDQGFLNISSLLDAVMNEPVGLQQDDDVTVLNRPAAEALYQPKHISGQDMDDEI